MQRTLNYGNRKKTMSHSQENEEEIVLEYFKDFKGNLLSIGENDGVILSNTRQLILDGWSAMLVEPCGRAFEKLADLYRENFSVQYVRCAIGTESGMVPFFESAEHITPEDTGLISTMIPDEIRKWKGSKFDNFTPTEVVCYTWDDFYKGFCDGEKFNFIAIDAEGMDWPIVQQMNLEESGCRCICVEFNSIPERKKQFEDYFSKFKFKLIGVTYHNLIFAL